MSELATAEMSKQPYSDDGATKESSFVAEAVRRGRAVRGLPRGGQCAAGLAQPHPAPLRPSRGPATSETTAETESFMLWLLL